MSPSQEIIVPADSDEYVLGNNLGTEMVNIYLGKDAQELVVHKALICEYDFFSKAFNGDFIESNGTMTMAEDDPEIFALFISWLYRRDLPRCRTADYFLKIINLYLFAEMIVAEDLANAAIDEIRRTIYHNKDKPVVTPDIASYIYRNTLPKCSLRGACIYGLLLNMVDPRAKSGIPADGKLALLMECGRENEDLLMDYLRIARENRSPHQSMWDMSGCFMYHVHKNGTPKCEYPVLDYDPECYVWDEIKKRDHGRKEEDKLSVTAEDGGSSRASSPAYSA